MYADHPQGYLDLESLEGGRRRSLQPLSHRACRRDPSSLLPCQRRNLVTRKWCPSEVAQMHMIVTKHTSLKQRTLHQELDPKAMLALCHLLQAPPGLDRRSRLHLLLPRQQSHCLAEGKENSPDSLAELVREPRKRSGTGGRRLRSAVRSASFASRMGKVQENHQDPRLGLIW